MQLGFCGTLHFIAFKATKREQLNKKQMISRQFSTTYAQKH